MQIDTEMSAAFAYPPVRGGTPEERKLSEV